MKWKELYNWKLHGEMKYGTRGKMEWEDKKETIRMWERLVKKVGIGKIRSMKNIKKGGMEIWKIWKMFIEIRRKSSNRRRRGGGGGGCKKPQM